MTFRQMAIRASSMMTHHIGHAPIYREFGYDPYNTDRAFEIYVRCFALGGSQPRQDVGPGIETLLADARAPRAIHVT